jgi:hypothetical protein
VRESSGLYSSTKNAEKGFQDLIAQKTRDGAYHRLYTHQGLIPHTYGPSGRWHSGIECRGVALCEQHLTARYCHCEGAIAAFWGTVHYKASLNLHFMMSLYSARPPWHDCQGPRFQLCLPRAGV